MAKKEAESETKEVQYRINFFNKSSNAGSFVVFQQDENVGVDGVMSLAWMTKYAHPGTQGFFNWKPDYDFVWTESDSVTPGIACGSSQSLAADLSTTNSVTLTYDRGYSFINQTQGPESGSLYVLEDQSIPLKQASVGIGMAGAPVFMVEAQPNMNLTFTPHPEYWIAFGEYETGEVLDIQEMTTMQAVEFPPGIFTVNAILNPDNTWTIEPA